MRQLAKSVLPAAWQHRIRVRRALRGGGSEPELAYCRRFLRSDAAAIDVGASGGSYTDILAAYSRCVLSIEPQAGAAAFIRGRRLGNVTVVEAAASDRSGTATLRIPVRNGTSEGAWASIEPNNRFRALAPSETREQSVAVDSLDRLVASWRPVAPISFIKIDVEGHELATLRGALELIQSQRPVVQVEAEERHGSDVAAVFNLFAGAGYSANVIDAGRFRLIDLAEYQARQKSLDRYLYNVTFCPS